MLDLAALKSRCPTPAIPNLGPDQARDLRDLAKHHKVSRAVAVRIEESQSTQSEGLGALTAALHEDADPSEEIERTLPASVARVDAAARDCLVGAFPIKGLAARSCYRRPSIRHLGDLDLWVSSHSDARRLAGKLEIPGTRFEEFDDYGVMTITAPEAQTFDIDIHYGLERHFLREDLDLPSPVPGLNQPPSELVLLSVLAGVAESDEALLKDANDVYAITGGVDTVSAMHVASNGSQALRRAAKSVTELLRDGFDILVPDA